MDANLPILFLVKSGAVYEQDYVRIISESARDHGYITALLDCHDGSLRHLIELLGFDKCEDESVVILREPQNADSGKFRIQATQIAVDAVMLFITDHANHLFVRSEEPVMRLSHRPHSEALVVVGSQFLEFLTCGTDKAKLVLFFTPSCSWCVEAVEAVDEVATRFHTVNAITVAKLDKSKNDSPGVAVTDYPTIMLFVNEDRFTYSAAISVDSVVAWAKSVLSNIHKQQELYIGIFGVYCTIASLILKQLMLTTTFGFTSFGLRFGLLLFVFLQLCENRRRGFESFSCHPEPDSSNLLLVIYIDPLVIANRFSCTSDCVFNDLLAPPFLCSSVEIFQGLTNQRSI